MSLRDVQAWGGERSDGVMRCIRSGTFPDAKYARRNRPEDGPAHSCERDGPSSGRRRSFLAAAVSAAAEVEAAGASPGGGVDLLSRRGGRHVRAAASSTTPVRFG